MSATREHRNAQVVTDAISVAASALNAAENLYHALGHALPDDFPALDFSEAHEEMAELLSKASA